MTRRTTAEVTGTIIGYSIVIVGCLAALAVVSIAIGGLIALGRWVWGV